MLISIVLCYSDPSRVAGQLKHSLFVGHSHLRLPPSSLSTSVPSPNTFPSVRFPIFLQKEKVKNCISSIFCQFLYILPSKLPTKPKLECWWEAKLLRMAKLGGACSAAGRSCGCCLFSIGVFSGPTHTHPTRKKAKLGGACSRKELWYGRAVKAGAELVKLVEPVLRLCHISNRHQPTICPLSSSPSF